MGPGNSVSSHRLIPSFRISHFAFRISPLVFLSTFALYLSWLTPAIGLEDSGEFATAAATLSLTHPPGYPLYILLGRLFLLVPAGSPGFRVALMSALSASLAAVFLYRLGRELVPAAPRSGPVAGAAAAALAPALVIQATIPDKYALNMALLSWLALSLWRASRDGAPGGTRRGTLTASLAFGLALSHHMQALYLLPGALGLAWLRRSRSTLKGAVLASFMFLAALSPKPAGIPLLSAGGVSLMYGRLAKAADLSGYLSAREYSGRFRAYTAAQKARRLLVTAPRETARQAGWPVLVLAVAGTVAGWPALRGFILAGAGAAVLAFALVARFQIAGVDYYVLPAAAFACVLAGAGLSALSRAGPRWASPALAVLLAASSVGRGRPAVDPSRYQGAVDRARNLLASVPDGGVLLTRHDDDFFPPMYLQRVLAERPAVVLVHRPFLTRMWHLTQVERLHTGFTALDPALIPWGKTVEPDMLVNMFVRSHFRGARLALSYPAQGETAGGFSQVPVGAVFVLGRPGPALPRPEAYLKAQSRLRMRGAFAPYPGDSRFREVAGAFAASWTALAARFTETGRPAEARACLAAASRFPYTRIRTEDREGLEKELKDSAK
jgi:hypothetical protein